MTSEGDAGAKPSPTRRRAVLGAVVVVSLLLMLLWGNSGPVPVADPMVVQGDVVAGEVIFSASCATCHGQGAVGTDEGPTLLDPIYRPGHHADGAFLAAVRLGVRQHHWSFGDMPPQVGLTDSDVDNVIAYVRQLQDDAGIR